jgi:hypothetical protein
MYMVSTTDPVIARLLKRLTSARPSLRFWLLFKVSSRKNLLSMQRGLMYMNSLAYFAGLEGEQSDSLRGDPDEPVLLRTRGMGDLDYNREFALAHCKAEDRHLFENCDDISVSVSMPSPKNVMVFCFSAFAPGPDDQVPGEVDGKLWLDPRFKQFGDHCLIVKDSLELSRRISEAMKEQKEGLFTSRDFQGGSGLVRYSDGAGNLETLGLFHKNSRYVWQREFRFAIGAKDDALNRKGALELRVGNIRDITDLMPLAHVLRKPIELRRYCGSVEVKKVGDKYVAVNNG